MHNLDQDYFTSTAPGGLVGTSIMLFVTLLMFLSRSLKGSRYESRKSRFPNREQMKGFFENTDDNEPIYMLNLLKFKDKAEYQDGRKHHLLAMKHTTLCRSYEKTSR